MINGLCVCRPVHLGTREAHLRVVSWRRHVRRDAWLVGNAETHHERGDVTPLLVSPHPTSTRITPLASAPATPVIRAPTLLALGDILGRRQPIRQPGTVAVGPPLGRGGGAARPLPPPLVGVPPARACTDTFFFNTPFA